MDWTPHVRKVLALLGEDVVFTHGGSDSTLRGIFLSPYQVAELGGGRVGVGGSQPSFVVMTADVPAITVNVDTLLRSGVTYTIRVKRPDDPGGYTVLDLKRT